MFGEVSNWIIGGVVAIMSVGALFAAAAAGHGVGYLGGIAMFAFCVILIFRIIKASFDDHS